MNSFGLQAEHLASLEPLERLREARRAIAGRIVFTTSFGLEDQVLTHLIFESALDIEVVTLETGRLFQETLDLWETTETRYQRRIRPIYPEALAVEAFVAQEGINGFKRSVEARKACCHARKVRPLTRALAGASLWVTGLRADQSANRASAGIIEQDLNFRVLKLNPLIDWTREGCRQFIEAHDVPVNALHARGFLSIGCAPCTRAVQPGELERAGRWWWEDEAKKECGLHVGPDGRIVPPSREGIRP